MFFVSYSHSLLSSYLILECNIGNRSGLILIRSGGFYVSPGPSNPPSKRKFVQIWAAGADGLRFDINMLLYGISYTLKEGHFQKDIVECRG